MQEHRTLEAINADIEAICQRPLRSPEAWDFLTLCAERDSTPSAPATVPPLAVAGASPCHEAETRDAVCRFNGQCVCNREKPCPAFADRRTWKLRTPELWTDEQRAELHARIAADREEDADMRREVERDEGWEL